MFFCWLFIWGWIPNTELAGYSYTAVYSVFVIWRPKYPGSHFQLWPVIRHLIWSWIPNTDLAGYSYIAAYSAFVIRIPNTQLHRYSIVTGYSQQCIVSNTQLPAGSMLGTGNSSFYILNSQYNWVAVWKLETLPHWGFMAHWCVCQICSLIHIWFWIIIYCIKGQAQQE